MEVMSSRGGITRIPVLGPTAYITFSGSGAALRSALLTRAPASSISIEDNVDIAVNKALSGDYIVASFGYRPVTITISGLDIYSGTCYNGGNSIQAFYDMYNVHRNKAARIDVGIAGGAGAGAAYRCVLVALQRGIQSASANTAGLGIGEYTIQLIGVKL